MTYDAVTFTCAIGGTYFVDTDQHGHVIGTLYHGDCMDFLPGIESQPGALCITDPPYNCGKDYGPNVDDDVPVEVYHENVFRWTAQIKRIAPQFCIVMPTREFGVWAHNLYGGVPVGLLARAANKVRNNWECKMSYLWTNIRPNVITKNVWDDIRLRGEGYYFTSTDDTLGYDGYTPQRIIDRVVSLCSPSMLIDPFCGTGGVGMAAKAAGIPYIGIDKNEQALQIAKQRLMQMRLSL